MVMELQLSKVAPTFALLLSCCTAVCLTWFMVVEESRLLLTNNACEPGRVLPNIMTTMVTLHCCRFNFLSSPHQWVTHMDEKEQVRSDLSERVTKE
jgi:hypothetical protein